MYYRILISLSKLQFALFHWKHWRFPQSSDHSLGSAWLRCCKTVRTCYLMSHNERQKHPCQLNSHEAGVFFLFLFLFHFIKSGLTIMPVVSTCRVSKPLGKAPNKVCAPLIVPRGESLSKWHEEEVRRPRDDWGNDGGRRSSLTPVSSCEKALSSLAALARSLSRLPCFP